MKIYDTLSGDKKTLEITKGVPLKLFVCGPTVYDYPHIGHARTYLVFDMFVRFLTAQGYSVHYLQNITDIDDKIIDRAKQENTDPRTLAKKFEEAYYEDMETLGIKGAKYARATDHIPEIVVQIQTLLKKGHAYEIPGDGYYFDLSTFPEYGKLSHRTALQAEDSVSRVDDSTKKRNKGDFALWKFEKPGEPAWESPFGRGRPGWHIEDTAITEKEFGPQYDMHGGAIDLIFPHHEAELTQQESASGKKPFVKIWMHTGFLLIDGKKMSKSLGNFITIRDFLNTPITPIQGNPKYKPTSQTLRMMTLMHHYRTPLNYIEKLMPQQAQDRLWSIQSYLFRLSHGDRVKSDKIRASISKLLEEFEREFNSKLENDFNTGEALASIDLLWRKLLAVARDTGGLLNVTEADAVKKWIEEKVSLFGFQLKPVVIPEEIQKLTKEMDEHRSKKKEGYSKATDLREKILALGFLVENEEPNSFVFPLVTNWEAY